MSTKIFTFEYRKKVRIIKADRKKLEMAMARACMNTSELTATAKMPRATVTSVICGRNVKPGTLGRIAKALNVDVAEILQD